MNEYKVVTVKHPNCNTPYTFSVPERIGLDVGDYVLCDTKKHRYPQIGRCITPSFSVSKDVLEELFQISPEDLMPIMAYMSVTWLDVEVKT